MDIKVMIPTPMIPAPIEDQYFMTIMSIPMIHARIKSNMNDFVNSNIYL